MATAKIMIVDDELSMRTYVKMMLEGLDYELILLDSGEALLNELEAGNEPDLIILDVIMPNIDGFEICRQIKAQEAWKPIPIIMVTVLDAKEALVKGTEAGADDFLPKPVKKLELRARVRSLLRIKQQYDQLDNVLHMREEMSNMVVHDMSSSITAIQLHTALLNNQTLSEENKEHLRMIELAADNLDSFVNDILMMAKLEDSNLHLNRSTVDINAMARLTTQQLRVMAQSKGIQLDLELPEKSINLRLDSNLFSRVFVNLLSNAIQYAPQNTRVILKINFTRPPDEKRHHLRIQVIDQGQGIPESDRERIFDKFEVVKLRQQGIKQIGLGLTFCKMVVQAHDGKIYILANQPQGSIFVVEI
jgi:signal transduction histidine kinase